MAKTIFEEMGDTYEQQGNYLIPCLTLSAEKEMSIDTWEQRHLQYLREYHTNLLTNGKLNSYLADIDKQAEDMFFSACRTDGSARECD